MDFFSKNKALTLTIIFLVVLNLISIGTILYKELRPEPPFMGPMAPRMERERMPGRMDGFLGRELNLTPDQREKFSEFRQEHFEKMQALEQELNEKKKEMMELALSEEIDTQEVDMLAEEIGILYARISRINVDNFQLMTSILDTSQVTLFKKLVKEIMPMQGPPGDRQGRRGKRRGMGGGMGKPM